VALAANVNVVPRSMAKYLELWNSPAEREARWANYGHTLRDWHEFKVHLKRWNGIVNDSLRGDELTRATLTECDRYWQAWRVAFGVVIAPAPVLMPIVNPLPVVVPTKRLELLIRVGATGSSGLVRVRGHVKSMQAIVIGEKLLKAPRVYPRLT
jgi:hypothetical protein